MMVDDNEVDERPLYSVRRRRLLRISVIVAVLAMVLPVVVNLVSVSSATAASACAQAVAYAVPDATGSSVRFEILGAGGIGWECYSDGGFGGDQHVASLGLVPGMVDIPRGVNT